ncbi:bas1, putative [Talaromyces stipitatus ATCC 10500]|uniref:Bas1, putative n=1 Tax=Talaromyces stipitatus (strain ATCC 10500 / CBS 375.48 / QM 6759 / NRRL 1006) TaxID=441959 RepID=B8LZ18_TALSN|nr:bas1, putative [Talaromyces stipitatus ATCC 10500]EED21062.1 bas1, putative [Talaromyces stipitatus ATCC 10500]
MPLQLHKWTDREDEILRKEVLAQLAQGEVKDWCCIASQLPGHTNRDCRKRWHNVVSGGLNKGHWTAEEDKLLIDAVAKHGESWTVVANNVSTRNADQCSKRWKQCLDPDLDRSQWSEEENRRLFDAYEKKGRRWKEIQVEYFPNRSRNAIKNQYTTLSRRLRQHAERAPTGRRRAELSTKTGEQEQQRQNMNTHSASIRSDVEEKLDLAESNCFSSADDSSDEDMEMAEASVESDVQQRLSANVSLMESSNTSIDSSLPCIPSPADAMMYASSLSHEYEIMIESGLEGLLENITELEPFPSLEGVRGDTDQLRINPSGEISVQTFANEGGKNDDDDGNMPLALPFQFDDGGMLLQQQTYPITKIAEDDEMAAVGYPDIPLKSLMPEHNSGSASPERVTLTLYNPSSDTIASLMKVAVSNNSPFLFERH